MKKFSKIISVSLVFVMVLSLFCGTALNASAKSRDYIKLNKGSKTLYVGKSFTLKVKKASSKKLKKVIWKSSKKSVATVSKSGKVKAKKKGNCKITAISKKNKKVKAVCYVYVYKKVTSPKPPKTKPQSTEKKESIFLSNRFIDYSDNDYIDFYFSLYKGDHNYFSTSGTMNIIIGSKENPLYYKNISFNESNFKDVLLPAYAYTNDGDFYYVSNRMTVPACCIRIKKTEIKKSYYTINTMYYTLKLSDGSEWNTNELPIANFNLNLSDTLPKTVNNTEYYSALNRESRSIEVTDFSYMVSNSYLYLLFDGTKTYDGKGNNFSSPCKIGWKIYDDENYVIDDGMSTSTVNIKVGEKFRAAYSSIKLSQLSGGKNYSLEIMGISS